MIPVLFYLGGMFGFFYGTAQRSKLRWVAFIIFALSIPFVFMPK